MIYPDKLPGQQADEKLVLLVRRHWLVLVPVALTMLLLAVAPALAYVAFRESLSGFFAHPALGAAIVLLACAYYLGIWMFACFDLVDYYLDVWIVTTERIINIEQHGLFNRTVSELHLGNIQDVTSEVKGILKTLLTFGDVLIQTSAEKTRFHFKDIPRPDQVKETILRLVQEDKNRPHENAPQAQAQTSA